VSANYGDWENATISGNGRRRAAHGKQAEIINRVCDGPLIVVSAEKSLYLAA
jgi:hypothetical protein